MPKVRNIILLLIIAGVFWHFYGDSFNRSGVHGVIEDIRSDVNEIKENPKVISTLETINQEIQVLFGKFIENDQDQEQQPIHPNVKKPDLDTPVEQSFSVHNVELGDDRSTVEEEAGEPERSTLNEYGVNWVTYHENFQNFFMVAYDNQDKVVGLYTNQGLMNSTHDVTFNSSRDSVLEELGKPLKSIRKGFVNYQVQSNGEYDTFLIDQNYVTIFYDKHEENTVTAIQIISEKLEQQKEEFFGEPSDELKEGFEYQLFDLTNAARVERGLPVLSWDDSVRKTARNHSKDMADNNYFSHTNPAGQSPFDRMEEDDIAFQMAGENLAAGQSSSIFAHEGLMNSLGHRENILHTDFRALGVGVAFNQDSQPYYTEMFLTK
ncbi:serine protease [Ornithinibacillus sp. L9]|uniref:Serine protease n=1 Tax=Ornithinibacillus caprae TaxID=2678566 RepID=A0A6N8FET1_9BACI|nr:CAP domain-containing protein [Ornithinibacillus caprae]MUK88033.1 serine protease [Ornithinibacillus caprae]